MASLRKFMASVGIGMGHLHLSVDQRKHPRGSRISGSVVLEGGIAVQHVRSLALKLIQYRPSGKTTEEKELANWMASSSIDLLPHSKHEFPFVFTIPDEAWLTKPPGSKHPSVGCRIDADADIAFAINPRCSLHLDVTEHREIIAVQLAMRQLGFKQRRPGFQITLKSPSPHQIVTHFDPPDSLKDQLDEAVLSLEAGAENVWGELDLDPHESTLGEKMRALVVTQYRVFPLDFERMLLLRSDGEPNPEAAIPRLHEILSESLVLPDNEKMRLLRPAGLSGGDTLLRPAATARTNPQNLLHPVEEEK
jgi:sporulation-control protein spo0M